MSFKVLFLAGFLALACCSSPAYCMADPGAISRKYTYETLSPYQKSLLDDFIEDEFPKGTKLVDALDDHTSLRNKTRLAQALLFRNSQDDFENALNVLRWILKYQHQDEKSRNYGIWRTSVVDDRLDQNWREFIGCDLIIIYQNYKKKLPDDILKGIEIGLTHAAKGALKRNVGADYTNISIMSAFLMDFVGTEFKNGELKKAGLKKADDIFTLYNQHKTFSEYNSPTYYGVTLIALALWRELALSTELREMGKNLESQFWNEITIFYNPNLMNMPGPYFRGYGMDMRKYYSITGLWIAIALNNKNLSPIPFKQAPKYGEVSNITAIFHLGLDIPKASFAQLTKFTGPRFISRSVPNYYKGDSIKHVTAMIANDWMMGGLWGNRRAWNQIKTGTIHWKTNGSDIGWLLVPGDGNTNVKVTKTEMKIYLANKDATQIQLFVSGKDMSLKMFADNKWTLSGMTLNMSTKLKRIKVEEMDSAIFQNEQAVSDSPSQIIKVTYEVPLSWDRANELIQIGPVKK